MLDATLFDKLDYIISRDIVSHRICIQITTCESTRIFLFLFDIKEEKNYIIEKQAF